MSDASNNLGLPVAVDVMGADLGPEIVIEGAVSASREFKIPVVIVGQESLIREQLTKLRAASDPLISIEPASEWITMEDSPTAAIRGKPNASIRIAFSLVQQQRACGVVSPGNSGAVMAAGISVCGILPGVTRPAIASLIPRTGALKPVVLLDSGANIECHVEQLVQFALMGNFYAISALNLTSPRIAILSNGSEPGKGTSILRESARILRELESLNFIGYVEGRDICKDVADVIVCDGLIGNIVLKSIEGTVELVFDSIREYVESSARGLLAMRLAKPLFKRLFKEKLDPSAYGGAPLLGLNALAVVCHGSSSTRAIKNGVRAAWRLSTEGVVAKIATALSEIEAPVDASIQDGIWDRMGQRFEGRGAARSRKLKKGAKEPDLGS